MTVNRDEEDWEWEASNACLVGLVLSLSFTLFLVLLALYLRWIP